MTDDATVEYGSNGDVAGNPSARASTDWDFDF